MKDSETIDEVIIENQTFLCSKWSIAIIGFLISPILATYLYSFNLRRTEQKEKITSFFIAIVIFNFLILLPFLGFELNWNNIRPVFFINKIIVSLLMVFPIWKNHFGDKEYEEFFPVKSFSLLIILFLSIIFFNYMLDLSYPRYYSKPWFIPRFSEIEVLAITILLVFIRFIYQLLKKLIVTNTKKTKPQN